MVVSSLTCHNHVTLLKNIQVKQLICDWIRRFYKEITELFKMFNEGLYPVLLHYTLLLTQSIFFL